MKYLTILILALAIAFFTASTSTAAIYQYYRFDGQVTYTEGDGPAIGSDVTQVWKVDTVAPLAAPDAWIVYESYYWGLAVPFTEMYGTATEWENTGDGYDAPWAWVRKEPFADWNTWGAGETSYITMIYNTGWSGGYDVDTPTMTLTGIYDSNPMSAPAPEPATMLMFGIAGAGMVMKRFRGAKL